MKVEAENLENAYKKAAEKLNCSVTELDIKVIQYPNKGVLGLFKKNAVIDVKVEDKVREVAKILTEKKHKNEHKIPAEHKKNHFKKERQEITDELLAEVKEGAIKLFSNELFEINVIEVSKYDDNTIYLKIDGNDAALLIGKEAHRYKALAYILQNWINSKYSLNLFLEISEFCKNQLINLTKYLDDLAEKIKMDGKGITKPLEGVFFKFALKKLRDEFPEKYVSVKLGRNGKFIVVNDKNKNE
ncbi:MULTISPECIES: Jag N-terminal domain-containing protein [Campylobacter]|uniref:Jag N-terminal domain-containing protein n=1 Tax=Campylobacter TaxID=194 RepID=UPI0023F523A3|nr:MULTISPECIES: Jag N-terminal domain-containing protein [Campylobacter]MCI6640980.1 Jag N-terminal domain-containing protein [Campylobacter sp.]MDD7422642.1 Jag N-terminal domain-containing protein [Campylobacter hominis]MDY3117613.1 Jag N-terminal domain-containing protein [Campylobacter hominis]